MSGIFAVILVMAWAAPTEAEITRPRYFIADTLGSACLKDNKGHTASSKAVSQSLENLRVNHQRYVDILNSGTSLTVNHDDFSRNWEVILFNSYAAAASGNDATARAILDGIGRLAAGRLYLDENGLMSEDQANRSVRCYAGGNTNSPCPAHTSQFVTRMYSNLFISAAVLVPFATAQDHKLIDPYFAAGYRKFVLPSANSGHHDGLYDFANEGLARLAYAAWTGDMALARKELSGRKRQFATAIQKDGYIRNNSFRGVRALWYHTYGLDPALSYALVARRWGVDYFRDPSVGPKLRAAVEKTALGITDYAAFRSVGNRGGDYSTDAKDARPFVHQLALNLYEIAAREFGIRLPRSERHAELVRLEDYSQTSGLSAACYYGSR